MKSFENLSAGTHGKGDAYLIDLLKEALNEGKIFEGFVSNINNFIGTHKSHIKELYKISHKHFIVINAFEDKLIKDLLPKWLENEISPKLSNEEFLLSKISQNVHRILVSDIRNLKRKKSEEQVLETKLHNERSKRIQKLTPIYEIKEVVDYVIYYYNYKNVELTKDTLNKVLYALDASFMVTNVNQGYALFSDSFRSTPNGPSLDYVDSRFTDNKIIESIDEDSINKGLMYLGKGIDIIIEGDDLDKFISDEKPLINVRNAVHYNGKNKLDKITTRSYHIKLARKSG